MTTTKILTGTTNQVLELFNNGNLLNIRSFNALVDYEISESGKDKEIKYELEIGHTEDLELSIKSARKITTLIKLNKGELNEDNIQFYFKDMNKTQKRKYVEIIGTVLDKRAKQVSKILELNEDDFRLHTYCEHSEIDGDDLRSLNRHLFCVIDKMKPIDEYVSEIKDSVYYKDFIKPRKNAEIKKAIRSNCFDDIANSRAYNQWLEDSGYKDINEDSKHYPLFADLIHEFLDSIDTLEITKENIHLYYEFMGSEDINKYRRLLNDIIEDERLEKLVKIFDLTNENYSFDEIDTGDCFFNIGLSVFGIKDILKPIDEYINEIKTSSSFREYKKSIFIDRGKSKAASNVLQLMDKDYSYKNAVDETLKSLEVDKYELEIELDIYI